MELTRSRVVFDSTNHTYHLRDKELSGVTTMLQRKLFPNKYSNVPDSILREAQIKGTYIHEGCELADTVGVAVNCEEVQNYMRLCKQHKLSHESSEYLVSDNDYIASQIDKVYRVTAKSFDLADIKTTAKYDSEYVKWQLSVYAYLFELQNPKCKVRNLYGIWLRGDKAELIQEERIPSKVIAELILADKEGRDFVNPYAVTVSESLPVQYQEIEGAIAEIDTQVRYWTDRKKQLVAEVNEQMSETGAYKWEGESILFRRKDGYIREDFDKEKFKAEYPELYSRYIKHTAVKGSVELKIK